MNIFPISQSLALAATLLLVAAPSNVLAQNRAVQAYDGVATGAATGATGGLAMHDGGESEGPRLPDYELRSICGEGSWLTLYEQDDNGNPVPGSYEYECLEDSEM